MCAIIASRIINYKWVNNLVGCISNKSINNNVWRDKLDFKNGTKLCVTVNDKKRYLGDFDYCEENGIDSWFVLKNYAITTNGDKVYSTCLENPDAKLVIQLKNVERVEIFPNQNKKDNISLESNIEYTDCKTQGSSNG